VPETETATSVAGYQHPVKELHVAVSAELSSNKAWSVLCWLLCCGGLHLGLNLQVCWTLSPWSLWSILP
jgi:hypothetical protein